MPVPVLKQAKLAQAVATELEEVYLGLCSP